MVTDYTASKNGLIKLGGEVSTQENAILANATELMKARGFDFEKVAGMISNTAKEMGKAAGVQFTEPQIRGQEAKQGLDNPQLAALAQAAFGGNLQSVDKTGPSIGGGAGEISR